MESIDALIALQRGDVLDQDTLSRLVSSKLVDAVTTTQLPGRELMFGGFTPDGYRLLQKNKALLVSDLERRILHLVVRGLLDRHEPTSTRTLLKELRCSLGTALHRLSNRGVLQVANSTYLNETYLPHAIAFYHCGDSAALAFARKSTEIVLRVLPILFNRELESPHGSNQRQFTAAEVENEERANGSTLEPNTIFTGLFLANDFSVFTGTGRDDKQVGIVTFSLGERVFEKQYLDWDDHIRRSNIALVNEWEYARKESKPRQTGSVSWENEPTLIPAVDGPLSLFVQESEAHDSSKIFVVHGHAEQTKRAVADFLRSVGLEPIILHEQPNQGRTIIEKFEKHSGVVGFAVVLLTPDDIGASAENPTNMRPRARQNVVLELGYFMGKLRRNKVCCLYVEGVELPSDYQGVLWLPYDDSGAWRDQLAKELTAAGIDVDSEKLEKVLSEQPKTQTKHNTETEKGAQKTAPTLKLDHATAEPKINDPMAERRWNRVRDDISKLPEYNREGLRLLLEYPSLTDYTALQKLGQLARQNSLASILPGLQLQTGLIRPVPGQPATRRPEYELHFEIAPELRPFVEKYFNEMQ